MLLMAVESELELPELPELESGRDPELETGREKDPEPGPEPGGLRGQGRLQEQGQE
jgi:hypothetical protein